MNFFKHALSRVLGQDRDKADTITKPAPDEPVYVIGDVHGRADLLDRLLGMIDDDIAQQGYADPAIVLVGDYVDRGEQSAEVLRTVHRIGVEQRWRTTCLRGNHEEMMLSFIEEPETGPRWLQNGGLQTMASFGIGGVREGTSASDLVDAAMALKAAIDPELLEWLEALPVIYTTGNVVIVHAAADPAEPIDSQSEKVLTWGHRDFLTKHRTDGLTVVHGHTIVDAAEVLSTRIPIDTGAIYTGRLTAAALAPDAPVRFLQT